MRVHHPEVTLEDVQYLVLISCGEDEVVDIYRTELVGTFDVQCPDSSVHKKLKAADGSRLSGHTIRVTNKKLEMSTKQIFDFVMQRLKDFEEGRQQEGYAYPPSQRYPHAGRSPHRQAEWGRDYSQVRGVSSSRPNKRRNYHSSSSSEGGHSQGHRSQQTSSRRDSWQQSHSRGSSWNKPRPKHSHSEPGPPSNNWRAEPPRFDARAQPMGRDMGSGKGKGKGLGKGSPTYAVSKGSSGKGTSGGKGQSNPNLRPPCPVCLEKKGIELFHGPEACWSTGPPCPVCKDKEGVEKFHPKEKCWYVTGKPPSLRARSPSVGRKGGQKGY